MQSTGDEKYYRNIIIINIDTTLHAPSPNPYSFFFFLLITINSQSYLTNTLYNNNNNNKQIINKQATVIKKEKELYQYSSQLLYALRWFINVRIAIKRN